MSANITISLPLETIAAIQSSTGPGLTPEILKHVSPALIQAAKALPVTFTPRNSNQSNSVRANGAAATGYIKPEPDSDPPAAKGNLVPKKRTNNEVDASSDSGSAATTQSQPQPLTIKVIPRDQPLRHLKLIVWPSSTIKVIKEAISTKWKEFPAQDQILWKGHRPLTPQYYPLNHFGVKENDVLYLKPRLGLDGRTQPSEAQNQQKVPIVARMTTGKEHLFDIPLSTTVLQIKMLIQDLEGIPFQDQRIIYGGKQLVDYEYVEDDGYREAQDRTLEMCGVQSGGTLHVVRLAGS